MRELFACLLDDQRLVIAACAERYSGRTFWTTAPYPSNRLAYDPNDNFPPFLTLHITDYECPDPGIYDTLGEYESLSELNYLANQIMELDESEEFWQTVLDLGEYTGSVQDLINLTENMDCFDYLPGVTDDSDLGYYWIEESGCYDTKAMGALSNYIDYESFGRDIRFNESGLFTDNGYIRLNGNHFVEVYDGNIENIPEEYRIQSPNVYTRAIPVKTEVNKDVAR